MKILWLFTLSNYKLKYYKLKLVLDIFYIFDKINMLKNINKDYIYVYTNLSKLFVYEKFKEYKILHYYHQNSNAWKVRTHSYLILFILTAL